MLESIDKAILYLFVNSRAEWISFTMLVVTYFGSLLVVSSLTLFSAISFYINKYAALILPLLTAVGGSAATTYIIKHLFFRARPIAEAFYFETGSSFPSGHATAAMALYGFLFYIVRKNDKHYLKKILMVFLFALIILVGVSRLYLGVHYLTDVLVGYAVGLIWILISIKLHKYILRFFGGFGS